MTQTYNIKHSYNDYLEVEIENIERPASLSVSTDNYSGMFNIGACITLSSKDSSSDAFPKRRLVHLSLWQIVQVYKILHRMFNQDSTLNIRHYSYNQYDEALKPGSWAYMSKNNSITCSYLNHQGSQLTTLSFTYDLRNRKAVLTVSETYDKCALDMSRIPDEMHADEHTEDSVYLDEGVLNMIYAFLNEKFKPVYNRGCTK